MIKVYNTIRKRRNFFDFEMLNESLSYCLKYGCRYGSAITFLQDVTIKTSSTDCLNK